MYLSYNSISISVLIFIEQGSDTTFLNVKKWYVCDKNARSKLPYRILYYIRNQNTAKNWHHIKDFKGENDITLFTKKEKIILNSELQRDDFIEKLDKAHVDYDVREDKASVFGGKVAYIFSIKATDLNKVV